MGKYNTMLVNCALGYSHQLDVHSRNVLTGLEQLIGSLGGIENQAQMSGSQYKAHYSTWHSWLSQPSHTDSSHICHCLQCNCPEIAWVLRFFTATEEVLATVQFPEQMHVTG